MPQHIDIVAADGRTLRGSLYRAASSGVTPSEAEGSPAIRDKRGAVDYRGVGDSRLGSIRKDDASLRDWGVLDIPAAIDWIARELRPRRLSVVGHSAGGQLVGLAHNARQLERAFGFFRRGVCEDLWRETVTFLR